MPSPTTPIIPLLLIDADPIFRLGLQAGLANYPAWRIVAEVGTGTQALDWLETHQTADSSSQSSIQLIILDLNLQPTATDSWDGLRLCQALRRHYPDLPILLLSAFPHARDLAAARELGVMGYCPKGTPLDGLITALYQVVNGQPYWPPTSPVSSAISAPTIVSRSKSGFWQGFRQSGLGQIDQAIARATVQLQDPALNLLERAILAGQHRELRATRWLVNRILLPEFSAPRPPEPPAPPPIAPISLTPPEDTEISWRSLQATLIDRTLAKLQSPLSNLTPTPLEIDLLRPEQKRELLYTILRKFDELLQDLRAAQIQPEPLFDKRTFLLVDLWQAVTTDFFGKYATLRIAPGEQVEVVPLLLQDAAIVQQGILNKVPQVWDLFAHLLFQAPLPIDQDPHPVGSPEALARAEILLQNLVIQVANAVVQPLLNRLANVDAIKQAFYDRRLLSSREIERFRNDLSWKYRVESLFGEPTAIFESRFWLYFLDARGIVRTSIYASRTQELQQLSGLPLVVTLALETRDAIAPRLRSAISFVGSGLIYLLTDVLGRGLGLVGRGILKGIGNAWQDPSRTSK